MIGCGCSSVCIPWLARGQISVIGCASPNRHSNQVFALLPFGRAITFISQHLGLPSPYGYFAVSTGYFDSANTLYAPEGGDSSQAPNAFRRSTFARGRSSKVQMTHPSGIRIYVPPALRDSETLTQPAPIPCPLNCPSVLCFLVNCAPGGLIQPCFWICIA